MKKGMITEYETEKSGWSTREVEYKREAMLAEMSDVTKAYTSLKDTLSGYKGHDFDAGEENFGIQPEDIEDGIEVSDFYLQVGSQLVDILKTVRKSLNDELSENKGMRLKKYNDIIEAVSTEEEFKTVLDSMVGSYREIMGMESLDSKERQKVMPYEKKGLVKALKISGRAKTDGEAAEYAKDRLYAARCSAKVNSENFCDLGTVGYEPEPVLYSNDDTLNTVLEKIKDREDICSFAKDNLSVAATALHELKEDGFYNGKSIELSIGTNKRNKMAKTFVTDETNSLSQDVCCGIEALIEGEKDPLQIAFGVLYHNVKTGVSESLTGSLVSPERAAEKNIVTVDGHRIKFSYRNETDKINDYQLEGDLKQNQLLIKQLFSQNNSGSTQTMQIRRRTGTPEFDVSDAYQQQTKGLSNDMSQFTDDLMVGRTSQGADESGKPKEIVAELKKSFDGFEEQPEQKPEEKEQE